jgi:hypothetical protein
MWLSLSVSYLRRHHAVLVFLLKKRREQEAIARNKVLEAGLPRRLPLLANCHILL